MENNRSRPVRRQNLLVVLSVMLAYALANEMGRAAQVYYGVSIIYPATAIAVASILHFGRRAALGVFIATLITPWGSKGDIFQLLLYYTSMGIINVAEGFIPYLILRKVKDFQPMLLRAKDILWFILSACVINTGIAAFSGNLLRMTRHPVDLLHHFMLWWFADGIAALTLGLALYLMIEHFSKRHTLLPESATGTSPKWRTPLFILLLILLISVIVYFTAAYHVGSYHLFAVLYLIPLLWSTWKYGLYGGVLVNAVISIFYVTTAYVTFFPVAGDIPGPSAFPVFTTIYVYLFFFALFTCYGGHLSDIKKSLLIEIDRRRRLVEEDFISAVYALSAAIEAKEPGTVKHLRRVATLALQVGKHLHLDTKQLDNLKFAAILHDVGKIIIPENILLKDGPLHGKEREIMKQHPEIGSAIVESVRTLQETAPLILHHHERWDGDTRHPEHPAYPEGCAGEAIPLGSRIIAVVDAFDSMTSDRPYRKALDHERAVQVLQDEKGKQFDPMIVDTFLQLIQEA